MPSPQPPNDTPSTLRWSTLGNLVLLVEGTQSHGDAEWAQFLQAMATTMSAHGGAIRVLVQTDGAGPSALQRQAAIRAGWENNRSPVAVVSWRVPG